jgi:hypothetical protein
MPILVSAPPPNVPVARPIEVFRMSWTAPSGRVTEFFSLGQDPADFITTPGVFGLDMPQFTPYTDTSPGFDGEINRGFRAEGRDVGIPILMYASDRATFKQMRHDLFTDLNPRKGVPGLLTVTEFDNSTVRSIPAFYAGGLEGALDDESQGQSWMAAPIEFRCPSPYWLGETIAPRPIAAPDARGWLPLYPIRATASQVLGAATIFNRGQAESWPLFRITGPATSIHLLNTTTGESLHITYVLDVGDVVVINTRPGHKSVVLNGTTNLYPYLSSSSSLWSLFEGTNEVTFTLPGQTPETTLAFTYQEQFLAAW